MALKSPQNNPSCVPIVKVLSKLCKSLANYALWLQAISIYASKSKYKLLLFKRIQLEILLNSYFCLNTSVIWIHLGF